MTIDGLPDKVSRSDLFKLLQVMGINPMTLVTLSIELHAVIAVVYALDTTGKHIIDNNEEAVTHKVVIPFD